MYRIQHNRTNSAFEFAIRTDNGGRFLVSNTIPQQGQWYFVVGTYDGQSLKLYVNGVLENSVSYSGGLRTSSSPLYIGSRGNDRYFNGLIDEVGFFDQALSPAQVSSLHDSYIEESFIQVTAPVSGESLESAYTYMVTWQSVNVSGNIRIDYSTDGFVADIHEVVGSATDTGSFEWVVPVVTSESVRLRVTDLGDPSIYGESQGVFSINTMNSNPVSMWAFEEADGIVVYDSFGINHGTLQPAYPSNVPQRTAGVHGNGLSFNGIDTYVEVDNANNLNPSAAITVSAWVRWTIDPSTGNPWANILSKDGDNQYRIQHNEGNTAFEFGIRTSEGRTWTHSTTVPQQDVWYFVLGTYDGETMKLYVNDNLVIPDEDVYFTMQSSSGSGQFLPVNNIRIKSGETSGTFRYSDTSDGFATITASIQSQKTGDFTWYEPAQQWVGYSNNTVWPTWSDANRESQSFIPGRGYLVSYNDNPTKEFQGELNHGHYDVALLRYAHPDDPFVGFNMIGNPYSASIDWNEALALAFNADKLDVATIWIWNDEEGQYGAYNPASKSGEGTHGASRYIAPMQGFWVRAATHGERFRLDNDVRTHGADPSKKAPSLADADILRMRVNGTANSFSDEVILEFGHKQTGGAEKMFSMYATAPSLYLKIDETNYSMGFMGQLEAHPFVPICFRAGLGDVFTFSVDNSEAFDRLILEDTQTEEMHDLKASAYVFWANPSDASDRFILHTGSRPDNPTSTHEIVSEEMHHVYTHHHVLYVQTSAPATEISLFDLQGRQLLSHKLNGSGLHSLPLNLSNGVYIVRTVSGSLVNTARVIIE